MQCLPPLQKETNKTQKTLTSSQAYNSKKYKNNPIRHIDPIVFIVANCKSFTN